jgi:hypothetical protein
MTYDPMTTMMRVGMPQFPQVGPSLITAGAAAGSHEWDDLPRLYARAQVRYHARTRRHWIMAMHVSRNGIGRGVLLACHGPAYRLQPGHTWPGGGFWSRRKGE